MKKINILSQSGDIVSTFDVKELAEDSLHTQAVFDAVNTENQNKRQSTAHTKTKADVSGTGKKPYRQKHTGRARQGSRRNPQFVGGGTAFGPKNNRNFTVKMNKQVHTLAFNSAWAHIIEKEQISILDKAFFPIDSTPKTSKVFSFLSAMKLTEKKVLLVVGTEENNLFLSARNIPTIIVKKVNNLSVRDLLNQAHILVSNTAWDSISNKIK